MSRVTGSQRVVQTFRNIRLGIPDVIDDDEYKTLLLRRIKARFMAGVAPDGTPWVNLSEETLKTKRRKGYPRPEQILYARGNLYRAIAIIKGTNSGIFATNTGLGFRIGVDDEELRDVARIHQYGFGRVPARPFLGVNANDIRSYKAFVSRRLTNLVRRA